ncbi:MAG TPA: phosphoglucosamine mutase [Vicinamibacteria bacterium]|nr:phosphoglucosamine mutase [Vicinamibacteria bacterium]
MATATPTRNLFGTDGVRGVANEHPMTPELALCLGRAVTFVAGRGKSHGPRIVLGKDTRLSGYMIETALASGICSMGGTVLLTGPIPTPAVAHLTISMRADAGVVNSASHNPYADNGIKVFGADGFKLPDEAEAEIERLMDDPALLGSRKTGPEIGRAERLRGALGRYVVFAKTTFPRDLSLEGVRLVVDAAHGAAYKAAPHVFVELGARVTALGVRPTGTNINRDVGALHPQAAAAEVLRRRANIGIALDGDADRVILIDEQGQVVDGDAVLALCAQEMVERKLLRGGTVVATVMSNLGLERALQRQGLRLERTPVGDRYVVEAMRQGGFNLGGEQSGHLIFLDHASTGDGIIAALQVLAVMKRTGRPLSELARTAMERVPQVLENVTLPSKRPLEEMKALSAAMEAAQREMGADGRVLVRWSGTEAKLRIMVEGPDEQRIRRFAQEMAEAARRDLAA